MMSDPIQVLQDVYVEETGTAVLLRNCRVLLRFSKGTGCWIGWRDLETGREWLSSSREESSLTFRAGGRSYRPPGVVRNSRAAFVEDASVIGANRRYARHVYEAHGNRVELAVHSEEGDWLIIERFLIELGSPQFEREVELAYRGPETIPLRDVSIVVPEVSLEDPNEWVVEAPGYPVRPRYPVSEMSPGQWGGTKPNLDPKGGLGEQDADAPASKPGVLGLCRRETRESILCWAFSPEEPSLMAGERTDGGIRFIQNILVSNRMEAGSSLCCGRQILASQRCPWKETLEFVSKKWPGVGIRVPQDRPAWADRIAIYEVHIGTAVFPGDRQYAPYPRIDDLIMDLPRIQSLGFDTLLVMPHQPFPGYSVHDIRNVEETYGGRGRFKVLVREAHELGLRVLLDFVMHGCVDRSVIRRQMESSPDSRHPVLEAWLEHAVERSPYRDEHPEWFMREEDGEIASTYVDAFDHANPQWQQFILEALSRQVREYDVDGFRIDAPTWNFMPNWDSGVPYRASASIYGAAELFHKARPILRDIKEDLLLYTEPCGPLFQWDFDLNYNYDEQWLFPALVPVVSARGFAGERTFDHSRLDGPALRLWLEERRAVLPEGSSTVHHLDSHDTFWWGNLAQFRSEAFGREAANALFALCAFLDGGVMNYVGGEKGAEDFYSQLLRWRREIPEIRLGRCSYLDVEADSKRVVPLLLRHEDGSAVPLIHLGDSSITCTLKIPVHPPATGFELSRLYPGGKRESEVLSCEAGSLRVEVPLGPYETLLLRLRPC